MANKFVEKKQSKYRNQAENMTKRRFEKDTNVESMNSFEIHRLIHELHVHQIELELQNEELLKTHLELMESRDKYAELFDFAPVGYFTFDENAEIIEVNLAGSTLTGIERNKLISKNFRQFIFREDQDIFYLFWKRLFETKDPQSCEIRLIRGDGTVIDVKVTAIDESAHYLYPNRTLEIKTSGKNIDEMFERIKKYADGVKNPYLKKLLGLFFEDKKFEDDFKNAAAAVRYHHAFKGGLLEHTLSVTEICDAIYRVYRNLNYDLLISGAILHDIGKIREYRTQVTTEVTDEGKLLGHITIGYGWVLEKIKKIDGFPKDLSDRLLHIILSHHGQKEFGSPKRPKIPEAFVVYHVDYMDADIGGYNIILEENKSGSSWSDYLKNFDRSVFLKKLDKPGDKSGDGIESIIDNCSGKDDSKTSGQKEQEELF